MKNKDKGSSLERLNLFILALFYERMDVIDYFINNLSLNLSKAIQDPITGSKVKLLIKLCKI